MKSRAFLESIVGLFILSGIIALFVLAFKVSGWYNYSNHNSVIVQAVFDEIGDLKVRAPVKIAGVRIGEIVDIGLDKQSLRAQVKMLIDNNKLFPEDSSASVMAASLLGSNYIAISPGYSDKMIANGGKITDTHPAMILQNLIGQAIFTPKDEK